MLYAFTGTDRDEARTAMNKALRQAQGKQGVVVRITDASSLADLRAALAGGGMFGGKQIVVLDGVFANEEMKSVVLDSLPHLKDAEPIFILEEKLDAEARKKLQKYAEFLRKFDLPADRQARKGGEIFSLAYALKGGDKRRLWVEYQRALSRDEAPEAIHGVLFWGAKDMLLRSRAGSPEHRRGIALVSELAELPHAARRAGFELEYALEHYILGINKS